MSTPVLELSQLQYQWSESRNLIIDIAAFSLSKAERFCLSGPSGSGKSTLLGLIGGVLAPRRGQVKILGQDLAALTQSGRDQFRADHLGFIFQMFNLLPYLSVLQNVLLALSFSPQRRQRLGQGARAEAERLLGALGLADADLWRRPVTHLSVGQQQRVAAARALLGSPELLIADEPTSALDPESRAAFLDLIFAECAKSGMSVLMVSHDQSVAALFPATLSLAALQRGRR